MRKPSYIRLRTSAFTLLELLIAAAIGVAALAALYSGMISIQKIFAGAEEFGRSKSDQLRLSDYLALDLRRALSITPGTGGDTILTLKIPAYYDSHGLPRTPTITKFEAHYGAADEMVTIVYRRNGASIQRHEVGQPPHTVATNVDDFQLSVQDLGKVVSTAITFAPTLSGNPNETARTATTVYNTTLLRNRR